MVDGDFKTVSLADYKGKYVVLFFCESLSAALLAAPGSGATVGAGMRARPV